jgi:hypothetical protein
MNHQHISDTNLCYVTLLTLEILRKKLPNMRTTFSSQPIQISPKYEGTRFLSANTNITKI